MAWAYLVGGDGDGQFFEWDLSEHVPLLRPRGELLRGPGRWAYHATGRYVSGAHGRCEVYEAHGQWVPYEEQDEQQDQRHEGDHGAGEQEDQATCPACAARGRADGDPAEHL